MTTLTRGRGRSRARARTKSTRKVTAGVRVSYALVVLYCLTLVIPLYWLTASAFKSAAAILAHPFAPSFDSGVHNFANVWGELSLGTAFLNSAFITGGALILTLVIAVPASYALARSTGRLARWVERIYALGFLIPTFAALVPTLLLAIKINMYATREFMVLYLPAAAQPLAVILLTQFMRTIPPELEESARVDGASRFRILWNVYAPLTRSGIVMVLILNFINFWNDYLFTLIIVTPDTQLRTVQVALPTLVSSQGFTDYGALAAGTVLSIAPVIIVYVILNRRMENALVQGAVKG